MWKRSVECLLYILVRALETLDLMEPCFIMWSKSNLERLTKSNEEDDVLPILKISAETDEENILLGILLQAKGRRTIENGKSSLCHID